jgi:hypothetical protein
VLVLVLSCVVLSCTFYHWDNITYGAVNLRATLRGRNFVLLFSYPPTSTLLLLSSFFPVLTKSFSVFGCYFPFFHWLIYDSSRVLFVSVLFVSVVCRCLAVASFPSYCPVVLFSCFSLVLYSISGPSITLSCLLIPWLSIPLAGDFLRLSAFFWYDMTVCFMCVFMC